MRPYLLCFALFIPVCILSAQNTRQNRAVFFPVTDYAGGWQPLPKTLPECKAIAGDLESLYGFKTEVWPNKNKQQLKDKLAELARATYGPQDQLLLFFSMHEHFDDAGDAGCLVPAGSRADDPSFDTWLLHTELRALVNRIPCEHILLVLDACYSGTFGGEKSKPPAPAGTDCETKIANALGRKSRLYLTAGGKEKVPADSDFARRWRTALGSKGGDDGLLTFLELQLYLSESTPAPKWGVFGSDQGGSFVLVPKSGCGYTPKTPADPDQAACESARRQNTIDAWEYYLEAYPNGRCRAEAQEERAWLLAQKSNTPAGYQMYLDIYGATARHAGDAKGKTAPPPNLIPPDILFDLPKYGYKPEDMVLVKGGTFQMGSDDGESNEKPMHPVTVSDFYLSRYEVTVAQFRMFVEAEKYETEAEKEGSSRAYEDGKWVDKKGRDWHHDPDGNAAKDNHPVINISWNDAKAYCGWLNRKTGKTWRLPTEAEWEYAAGNGSKHTKFSWGNSDPSGKKGGSLADETGAAKYNWTKNATNIFLGYTDGYANTAPVGTFDPNDFGLYDMTGNVWEWCSNWYGSDYYQNSPSKDPTGPSSGSYRVLRGGSWTYNPQYCRVANRDYDAPGNRVSITGFRLARTK